MTLTTRLALVMFVAGAMSLSTSWAQSKQTGAGVTTKAAPATASAAEQLRAGEGIFMQNCSFCHLPRSEGNPKTGEGKTIGPPLKGRMQGSKPISEPVMRAFILKGSTDKMPGFQYSLEPKEIDALIAYLKTF